MRSFVRNLSRGLALGGMLVSVPTTEAAEGGLSFYIEGQAVPLGGIVPPPGLYFDSTTYFYNGKIGGNRQTQLGGNVVANVNVNLVADFATALWVTPVEILGGELAFAFVMPFGEPAVRAGVLLNGPLVNQVLGRPVGVSVADATLNPGDPIVSASLGWHSGNWHWKLAGVLSIPAGGYEPGQLSNVALNRTIGDVSAAATYLDPALGIELSTAAGFTFNGKNPATQYTTGTEFHVDVSASKYLSKEVSVGVIASHYEQITGDSGPGARLGPFKGRATAVGGTISVTGEAGKIPITARLKVLREVEVENRFQGTIGFLEVSFPLWVAPPKAAPEPKPLIAKF
ncbi:SphA family protein [Methylobacterium planeticum]|uniref:Transporter n=1 Tax=Methylobacterium planeticum TaxID=2615211 RepID=A0A6N6MPP3_9HYPH|nr:transporter [Methylobacterium planeticum]KAB1072486.1 transporter [Methylobacterium planeticum]